MGPDTSPLAQLRDLHLPSAVSWWPPAIGWWALAALVIALCGLGAWVVAYRRRTAPRRRALAELAEIRAQFESGKNVHELIRALSRLLRRCALVFAHRREAASLTGQAWMSFLDQQGGTRDFTNGPGHVFAASPYIHEAQSPGVDGSQLLTLVERWITRVPLRMPRSPRGPC